MSCHYVRSTEWCIHMSSTCLYVYLLCCSASQSHCNITECVSASQIWTSRVSHMKSCVTHTNMSCQIYEWVMSDIPMRHVSDPVSKQCVETTHSSSKSTHACTYAHTHTDTHTHTHSHAHTLSASQCGALSIASIYDMSLCLPIMSLHPYIHIWHVSMSTYYDALSIASALIGRHRDTSYMDIWMKGHNR